VQADGLLLAVAPADATQPVLRVPDQRPAFQAERSRAAVGPAYPAFRRLPPVQLAAVQPGGNEVPQSGARWMLRPTDGGCQRPTIDGVALEGSPALALRLHQAVPLPQCFGLPPLPGVNDEAHLPQEPVQVFFANLHRTEEPVPLATFAGSSHGLHVLHHHLGDRQNLQEMRHHPRFGLPPAARRGRNAVLPLEPVVGPLGPAPLAVPPRPAHGAAHLDRLFHVVWRFRHEVEHRLFGADHAVALERASGVNARHKRLVVRFLFVGELHVEQAQLVAPWSRTPALEQSARFGRRAGHQLHASTIDDWDSHKDFLSPGRGRGVMTLPDGPSGVERNVSLPSASAWPEAVFVRVARKRSCSRLRCCFAEHSAR
jgi:hypothetical protein